MAERDIINDILVAASRMGARWFRQNTGMGWVGRVIRNGHQTMVTEARPFHAGLCVGSSDIIGWTPIEVTPDMVGRTLAVFTAVEVKTGKLQATKEQRAFLRAVEEAGGIAKVARGPGDIETLL